MIESYDQHPAFQFLRANPIKYVKAEVAYLGVNYRRLGVNRFYGTGS